MSETTGMRPKNDGIQDDYEPLEEGGGEGISTDESISPDWNVISTEGM